MNRWMKRRIERSRARCERATVKPQINTDSTDKKASVLDGVKENVAPVNLRRSY